MDKKQAEKLYQLSENGFHVVYTASPFVVETESGRIEKSGTDYVYRDSVHVEISLLDEPEEDFNVYQRLDDWAYLTEFDGGLSFPE